MVNLGPRARSRPGPYRPNQQQETAAPSPAPDQPIGVALTVDTPVHPTGYRTIGPWTRRREAHAARVAARAAAEQAGAVEAAARAGEFFFLSSLSLFSLFPSPSLFPPS